MYTPKNTPKELDSIPTFLEEELSFIAESITKDSFYLQAQLADAGSVINNRLKAEGIRIWDSTNKRPLWASGDKATDAWVDGTGTVVITPV